MQRDLKNFSNTAPIFFNFETGGYVQGAPLPGNRTCSNPTSSNFPNPNVGGQSAMLEFELYEKCPQNLIIFDQTDLKHRVMYNPGFARKFGSESLDSRSPNVDAKGLTGFCNSPSFKEDTNEIDILLSTDEEGEEIDDDTASTGRSPVNWNLTASHSSFCGSSYDGLVRNESKREIVQKMIRVMQEILPGMEGLDTGTVLDEAIRYLNYLKMEVERLGISNFN